MYLNVHSTFSTPYFFALPLRAEFLDYRVSVRNVPFQNNFMDFYSVTATYYIHKDI